MTSELLPFISSPLRIGNLTFSNRLIQGPLAGISAAPFRRLFYQFLPPAYIVTEMMSANDVLTKHTPSSRYLYRAPEETQLCYQLSGTDPEIMAQAAVKLQQLGADVIDINCGCPKMKIRKKGAGSALMDNTERLLLIVNRIREKIQIPLTVKLRIYNTSEDFVLAKRLEKAGVDALIIHGRRWTDDYDTSCNFQQIALIKAHINIPVIANGDITDCHSLYKAVTESHADAYMVSRAGCGRPWLYQSLLQPHFTQPNKNVCIDKFIQHVHHLSLLESEHQAVIQSRKFIQYYFPELRHTEQLNAFYTLTHFDDILTYLKTLP